MILLQTAPESYTIRIYGGMIMSTYAIELMGDEKTEELLNRAFELAVVLPENAEYLDKPWFTREYQLVIALQGSAASSGSRPLHDTWINESLTDHIRDMERILSQKE